MDGATMTKHERFLNAATRLNNEAGWMPKCYTRNGKQTQFNPCAKARVYLDHIDDDAPALTVTTQAASVECLCHGGPMAVDKLIEYEFTQR